MAGNNPFLKSPLDAALDDVERSPASAGIGLPSMPKVDVGGPPAAGAPAAPKPAARTQAAGIPNQADFEAAAKQYKIPANVLMALAEQRSRFVPVAFDEASGRAGLMGLDPATAKALGVNPLDAKQSINAVAKQLADRIRQGEPLGNALSTFAGPDAREVMQRANRFADLYQQGGQHQRDWSQDPAKATSAEPGPAAAAEDKTGLAGDMGRSALGGIWSGVGMAVRGIGKIPQVAAEYTTKPVIDAITGKESDSVNFLDPAADWFDNLAKGNRSVISEESKRAVEDSTAGGNLLEPSTWTFGKAPSLRGYLVLGSDVLGSMAPVVAASVATAGQGPLAGAIAGGFVGGAQGGGAAAQTARQTINDMAATYSGDDAVLAERGDPRARTDLQKTAYYSELVARGVLPAEAQEKAADAAERWSFLLTVPVSAAGGALTNKLISPASGVLATHALPVRAAGTVLLSGAEEGTQEAAESYQTTQGINVGAGANLDPMQGTFGDFVLGAIGGGAAATPGALLSPREKKPAAAPAANPAAAGISPAPAPAAAGPAPAAPGAAPAAGPAPAPAAAAPAPEVKIPVPPKGPLSTALDHASAIGTMAGDVVDQSDLDARLDQALQSGAAAQIDTQGNEVAPATATGSNNGTAVLDDGAASAPVSAPASPAAEGINPAPVARDGMGSGDTAGPVANVPDGVPDAAGAADTQPALKAWEAEDGSLKAPARASNPEAFTAYEQRRKADYDTRYQAEADADAAYNKADDDIRRMASKEIQESGAVGQAALAIRNSEKYRDLMAQANLERSAAKREAKETYERAEREARAAFWGKAAGYQPEQDAKPQQTAKPEKKGTHLERMSAGIASDPFVRALKSLEFSGPAAELFAAGYEDAQEGVFDRSIAVHIPGNNQTDPYRSGWMSNTYIVPRKVPLSDELPEGVTDREPRRPERLQEQDAQQQVQPSQTAEPDSDAAAKPAASTSTAPEPAAVGEDAEESAPSKERKKTTPASEMPINPVQDDLLAAIAKAGGLSVAEARSQGIDSAEFNRRGAGIRRIFTKNGASFDQMAESLIQHGYPVSDERGYSANVLLDRVQDALAGRPVRTPQGDQRQAEADYALRAAAEGDLAPIDALAPETEVDASPVERYLAEELLQRQQQAAEAGIPQEWLTWALEQHADNPAGALALVDSLITPFDPEDFAHVRSAEAATGITRNNGTDWLDAEDSPAEGAGRNAGAGAEGFALEPQTEAEIRAKEAREQDEAAAAAAASRRQIDATRDSFTLSTGTATAGEQLAPAVRGGQAGDMFASPRQSRRQGEEGMKLESGEVVLTATGRETTPFPRVDTSTERKATSTVKRVEQWLMDNAIAEAESRGDEFNARPFRANRDKPSQSDKDSAEMYLFSKDMIQPTRPNSLKPLAPEGEAATYGASNTIVTADRAAEIREKLKAKLRNQLNTGIDPEIIALGTELAVFHIEAGVRKFGAFAEAMARDLEKPLADVKKYMRSWYNGARDMMEDAGNDVSDMDSADAVREQLKTLGDGEQGGDDRRTADRRPSTDGGRRKTAPVDPEEAAAQAKAAKANKVGLQDWQEAGLTRGPDRDPTTGLLTDDEMLPAIERAQKTGDDWFYHELDFPGLSAINKALEANSRADEVIAAVGQRLKAIFGEKAILGRRTGLRFSLLSNDAGLAGQIDAANTAYREVAQKFGVMTALADSLPGGSTRLMTGSAKVASGATLDVIVGEAQKQIDAAKPQGAGNEHRESAYSAWLDAPEGQARGIAGGIESSRGSGRPEGEGGTGGQKGQARGREAQQKLAEQLKAGYAPVLPAPKKAPGAFLDPEAFANQQYDKDAESLLLNPEQKAEFQPVTKKDRLFGDWFTDKDRKPTIARAIELVRKTGGKAFYLSVDVSNLGGMTDVLGHALADAVFSGEGRILQSALQQIQGLDVIPFRHGGDEFSFVVAFADPDIDEDTANSLIQEAADKASRQVQSYASTLGINDLPHRKYIGEAEKYGTGIYIGVRDILANETPEQISDRADERSAQAKNEGKPSAGSEAVKLANGAGSDQGQDNSSAEMVDHLYGRLARGEMPRDNTDFKKWIAEFDGADPSQLRMKQAQEDLEAAIVRRARDIVAEGKPESGTFLALVSLYKNQPNLNIRTSTSIENQAYSTPAPLAYLAARAAGIDGTTRVYEPTAGNGMLLITASPQNATANELEGQRYRNLVAQGFDAIQGDAMQAIESGAVVPGSQDAVITNPPFGSIKDEAGKATKVVVDGYRLGKIDHLIAAEALKAMKDDGRATLIIGADKVAGGVSTDDRIFFNWLYGNYNVVSHYEADGKLYGRQGASWPVRVITIAGRQKSSRVSPAPGTIARVNTWEAVYEQHQALGAAQPAAGVADPAGGTGAEVAADDGRTAPAATERQAGRPGQAGGAVGTGRGTGAAGGSAAGGAGRVASPDSAVGPDAEPAGADSLGAGGQGAPAPAGRPEGGAGRAEPGVRAGQPVEAGNAFQAPYVPRSVRKDEGILIPVNMAQPLQDALSSLEDAVGDIDEYARAELGYDTVEQLHDALMGLQVDSVASAIYQMGRGKAIVIADQTGIGKGRQAAAVIRWARNKGYVPVFVTVKPSLFTDMYNDLADIGTTDLSPFIMNREESIKAPSGEKLFANRGDHRGTLDEIASTGQLPAGRDALFMTYSQINVDNTQRRAITALSQRAVFILDESHNAGGESATGQFIRDTLATAAGVTYLSATYAKRPDNMPLYFKTDIGEASGDDNTLMSAMEAGGLPLQTVVANNLVKAGQMFRRERSYDGVSIETRAAVARRKEHEAMSDRTTEALRAIVAADKAFHIHYFEYIRQQVEEEGAELGGGVGNNVSTTVDHSEFSSVVHNFVRQMLLGLKADEAADEAIASLKRGEKPLIAVENTMGSFLNEYAATLGLTVGDALGDYSYRTVLNRALERSRYIKYKHPNGEEEKRFIPLSELDPISLQAYERAQEVIDALNIEIPASPLDWIRNRITQAGYSVMEITGRNLSVDYSGRVPALGRIDAAEQSDKVRTTRMFNDGQLDAIILNVAGSTGISLHASEKFKDQRVRHMVVAQPAQDINIFMQMLGRIHRTGQVKLPKYTILNVDLPAEKRPTAVLSRKMKSLNANTSSNTESATSVKSADFLNKYGDRVVAAYLAEDQALAMALNITVSSGEKAEIEPDLARKATGRLALMPVEVQKQFYEDVEGQYNDLIEYLNKTNQNELEPRTFDFDAREIKSQVLVPESNPDSPFGQEAVYNELSIKAQGKPMTPQEIREAIADNLDGARPEAHLGTLMQRLNSQFEAYVGTVSDENAYTARGGKERASELLRRNIIGTTLRLDINDEQYNGVITNVRSTHKTSGNPFSLSKLQFTIAVNGSLRSVTVPGSQFEAIVTGYPRLDLDHAFRERPADERELAKVVTGNLLAAYGEIAGTRGTIINFTRADGSHDMGILLPKVFNPKVNFRNDYRFKTSADALRFLSAGGKETDRFGISSRDALIRVLPVAGGGILIQVPKSKAKGGRYFLDKNILAATGDFVSKGSMMTVSVPASRAIAALDAVMAKQALYALPSMSADARALLNDPLPAPTVNAEAARGTAMPAAPEPAARPLAPTPPPSAAPAAAQDGEFGTAPAPHYTSDLPLVEHTAGSGKVLRGVIAPKSDFPTLTDAKSIDRFTFAKNGGWFIRAKHVVRPQGRGSARRSDDSFTSDTVEVDGKQRTVFNSKGQRIAQTEEGLINFWRWFKDSVVVDEQGRPKVMYHGSIVHGGGIGDITAFDRLFTTSFRGHSVDTMGSWFSDNPGMGGAEMYSSNGPKSVIYPVYLSVQKPHETFFAMMLRRARKLANGEDDGRIVRQPEVDAYRTWLKVMGKDGINIKHDEYAANRSKEFAEQDAYVVLEATQVKSATANDGTFDPENSNIMARRADDGYFELHQNGIQFDFLRQDDDNWSFSLDAMPDAKSGTGVATALFIDGLERIQQSAIQRRAQEGYLSESILSNESIRLHERLIKAGMPFEKEGRAYSLGPAALLDVDFDAVRKTLNQQNPATAKVIGFRPKQQFSANNAWSEEQFEQLNESYVTGMADGYERTGQGFAVDFLRDRLPLADGVLEKDLVRALSGDTTAMAALESAIEAARYPDGRTAAFSAWKNELRRVMAKVAPFDGMARRTQATPLNSRRTKPQVEAEIRAAGYGWLLDNGGIVVHQNGESLPGSFTNKAGITGFAWRDGSIHVNAAALNAKNKLMPVLLHEAFHARVRPLIGGAKWDTLMKELGKLYRQSKASRGALNEFLKVALEKTEKATAIDDLSEADQIEEFGAYALDAYDAAPRTVKLWVDDMLGAVKAWLLQTFGKQFGAVTPAQLRQLARAALRDRRDGPNGGGKKGAAARAFHGSPYTFEKFTTEKMGAGEGNQAFGWGLYFAGKKEVAEFYRDSLRYKSFDIAEESEKRGIQLNAAGRGEIVRQGNNADTDNLTAAKRVQYANAAARQIPIEQLEKLIADYRANGKGRLYEVEIPDEGAYLLWDKPLAEQPEAVRKALESLKTTDALDSYSHGVIGKSFDAMTGGALSNLLHVDDRLTEDRDVLETKRAVSELLHSLGIAGVKYLDGASRNRPLKDIKREFLAELPEDAEFDEVMDLVGTGRFSPANEAIIKALADNDWLGFDYPAQAISVALGGKLADFDPAPELVKAVSDAQSGGNYNYVIFNEDDVQVRGMARRTDDMVDDEPSNRFEVPPETRGEKLQRWVQDRFNRVAKVQEAIVKQGGTMVEAADVYRAEERYHGRITARIEDFMEEEIKPFIEAVAKADVTLDEVAEYAYAEHAKERNDYIASINERFEDGTGSGMTTDEADAILSAAEAAGTADTMAALTQQLRDMAAGTRKVIVNEGLESAATVQAWDEMFQKYVPLKGFEKTDEMGVEQQRPSGIGAGFSVRGRETKATTGRESRASQIIENIVAQRETVLKRAEKNRVAKSLLRLVLDNPDPSLWAVNEITRKPVVVGDRTAITDIFSGQPAHEPRAEGRKVKYVPVRNRYDDSVIVVKIKGRETLISIKDPILAEQLHMRDAKEIPPGLSHLNAINRALARMWTSLNPVFTVTNYSRDIQTAMMNALGAAGGKVAAKTVKYAAPFSMSKNPLGGWAMKAIYDGMNGKSTDGARWYQEYRAAGGKTGFMIFDELEDKTRKLEGLLKEARGDRNKLMAAGAKVIEVLEGANSIIENAARLGAYRAAIEEGMTQAQAISLAKNLTVNFNRRGEWTHLMGSLYLFFNPAVQGTTRMVQALKSRKVQTAAAMLVIGTASLAALNAMLGGDDEDGESYYDKIPASVRDRNLIIMAPWLGAGKYHKIPMPYGYAFFASVGNALYETGRGAQSNAKTALNLALAFTNNFNPIDTGTPTVLTPFLQIGANRDHFGRKIMPEQSPYELKKPDSQLYFPSMEGSLLERGTTWLNEATGGNDVRPGSLLLMDTSISPESVEHLIKFVTGGLGTAVMDVVKVSTQDDREFTTLPFVKQVVGSPFKGQAVNTLYERSAELDLLAAEMEFLQASGQDAKAAELDAKHGWQLALVGESQASRANLSRLRKQQRAIEGDKGLPADERKTAVRELRAEMDQVSIGFNTAYNAARKEATGVK